MKYRVHITSTIHNYAEIEADSEQEALEQAECLIELGDILIMNGEGTDEYEIVN